MAFAEINGYRMHYPAFGKDDAPVMALIHGELSGVNYLDCSAPHGRG